jgi:hypothetical protein
MTYSLKQAGEATGKAKSSILRAIQIGKISATKDANGEWQIDPSELHRVYKPVAVNAPVQTQQAQRETQLYERLLADRDQQLAEKDRQLAILAEQLAAANEERRTTLRQLTALLTDQRAKPASEAIPMPPPASPAEVEDHPDRQSPPHVSPPPSEASWWRKMVGGR